MTVSCPVSWGSVSSFDVYDPDEGFTCLITGHVLFDPLGQGAGQRVGGIRRVRCDQGAGLGDR